jgi:hypothetical protein
MQRMLLLVLSLALVLFGGTAASAASAKPGRPGGHFCVARAVPSGSTSAASVTCYRTFAASILAATGGRVRLPAHAAPGSVTPTELNAGPAVQVTQFVLSIDYQNSNFTGSTLTWTQASRCGSFQAGSMPAGWNDVVSSVAAAGGCATTLFWNNNFGSPTDPIGRNGSISGLGVFNDQTSSQTWCPSAPCGR